MSLAGNIAHIQERIVAAAARAGRGDHDVVLMAVSKTVSPGAIREAYECGLRVFGENRVQEFAGKAAELSALSDAAWHLIGHLQTNKANKAVELFSAVDSVDSLKLAGKLNLAAEGLGRKLEVLIEINIGGEEAKSGVDPASPELAQILEAAPRLEHLAIHGLMAVPPFTNDPQQARPYFRKMRELRENLSARKLPGIDLSTLSMGMSHDFEVAIEEGSTCVRVGTAIFGERTKL